MRTVATAPVFGRDMEVISVQNYFSILETIDGYSEPERRYAVVTVRGKYGGTITGVIAPVDSIFIDGQPNTVSQDECPICENMRMTCDFHANYRR